MRRIFVLCALWLACEGISLTMNVASAHPRLTRTISGKVSDEESHMPVSATLTISGSGFNSFESVSDSLGLFSVLIPDVALCTIAVQAQGFESKEETIEISNEGSSYIKIVLIPSVKLIMDGTIFGGPPENELPLKATLTTYVNSDFIAEDSAMVLNGEYKESFKNFGWYIIDLSAPGFARTVDTIWVMNSSRKVLHRDYHLVPLESKLTTALNNIEFDFDKTSLRQDAYTELDYLGQFLKHNPDKQVEITGHTDNAGQKLYNLLLSTARAQAVADYLKRKGVPKGQLLIKGYGEEKPVDSNITTDGKAKNRRVELVLTDKPADKNIAREPSDIPRAIHFAFGATAPGQEGYQQLNRLAEYVSLHAPARVEIAGHTDDTGSEEYNYILSLARANAVVDYLKSKVASTVQLTAKGYGEKKPITSNLSHLGKANNRRVEITMLNN